VIATDISLGEGLTADSFALAGGNHEFFVATAADTSLVGVILDGNAHVTRRTLGTKDDTGLRPFAAFNGSEYLVLWDRGKGAVVRGGAVTAIAPLGFTPASLTAAGRRFIATTAAAGVLRAVVLDDGGTSTVADIDSIPPVAAAWNGNALLVAYARETFGWGTTYARLVDATGAPATPEIPIAFAPPSQTAPSIAAADEREALTVWSEREEASIDFRARAALLRDGVAGASIDLGPSGAKPSVAFGASTYLAVWARHDGDWFIEGRRVARDGTPLDAAPFLILHSSITQDAVVSFDGENFVVASVIYPSAAALGEVVAVRVRPDGAVLDPEGIVVHRVTGVQRIISPPVIASSGDGSIILWREQRDLFAATLGGGATKIAELVEVQPTVAWTGTTYIVAWTDIFARALRWAALDASGNPTGTPGALPLVAANVIDPPAVARFGDGALIAWVDISSGSIDRNIRAIRVAADGSLLAAPFDVAASEQPESAIAAAGSASAVRFAYQRAIDFPGAFRLPRVFTRVIVEGSAPRRRVAAR